MCLEHYVVRWQNAPTTPTTTASYLYDGEGNRVEQQVTSSGTTTTTTYVGNVAEVATTGSTSTTTTYYYAAGQRLALAVNGAVSYLASDGQGSAAVAVDAAGNPQSSKLYMPYGGTRWAHLPARADDRDTERAVGEPDTDVIHFNCWVNIPHGLSRGPGGARVVESVPQPRGL